MKQVTRLFLAGGLMVTIGVAGLLVMYTWPLYAWSLQERGSITTLFPPDDNPLEHLIPLIDTESSHVCIAAYRLTDEEVARAIDRAAERGVSVEVVADASALEARYNKVLEMLTRGIHVYVYPPLSRDNDEREGHVSKNALMHNKFMVFHGNNTVWTGSCNFTMAARNTHQENVVIMHDPLQRQVFMQQFQVLKRRSSALTPLLRGISAK